jgi:hypothetical protein
MKMGGAIRDSAIRAAMADMVNAVAALKQSGHVELSEALKQLVERVVGCEILPQTRQEIIEDLVFVGQQALLRPEQRKRGVVKAVLAYVKQTMQTVHPLAETWHTFGRTIENFFNL